MSTITRIAVVVLLLSLTSIFPAAAWPDRPVRLLVGFQAGGGQDVIARILAERLRLQFEGASFVVENKPGASGMVAAGIVQNARDGHTLLVFGDSYVITPLVNSSVRVRLSRDFKMVSTLSEGPIVVLAAPKAPFRDFAEMVSYVRANPGKVSYASSGIAGPQHLTGEYLSSELKLEMVHVPSRGGSQAVTDLLGSQLELAILGLGPTLPHIRSGALKALAVTTEKRIAQLPDTPTLSELGVKGFAVTQWFGLAAASDTPDAVVERLAKAVAVALDDAAVRQRYEEVGYAVATSSPAALTDRVRGEELRWKKLIDDRGLKVE
jgi:tripartite-type tricarboxylate transporter receptor subunit TctC